LDKSHVVRMPLPVLNLSTRILGLSHNRDTFPNSSTSA
jgi:hypothetical protein